MKNGLGALEFEEATGKARVSWWYHESWMVYPLVNIPKAIENGPFIVDLPIKNGDFPWFC